MDTKKIKSQFPVFKDRSNLVYLDNAATTQSPKQVVDTLGDYYKNKSNVHRGFYNLAIDATKKYEQARQTVADFISAEPKEVVFTSGTTDSLNNIARILEPEIESSDNIVITIMEHHANLIPWQQLSKRVGCELRYIEIGRNYEIDLKSAKKKIDENTKVVSFSYISNALGVELPVEKLIKLAKKVDAYTIIDAAQAMTSKKIDIKDLGVDFLAFSGHKIFGPTGIGVMHGRGELLDKLEPPKFGGEMIEKIEKQESSWADLPAKFEAGTPNIAGAIGLGKAVDFVESIGQKNIAEHQAKVTKYLAEQINNIEEVRLHRPDNKYLESGIVSFTISSAHPHDIADILGKNNICVRAGYHCTMPLMKELGLDATVRASVSIYNTKDDIDQLVGVVDEIIKRF